MICLYLAASAAPSPLYVVYQDEWGFSDPTLTVVFAVYVFGLLASLLVLGSLSDYVGRRPLICGSLALETVAMVLFLVAGDVGVLMAARTIQGIATGIAMTSMGAALVDLDPPERPGLAGVVSGLAPISGLAIGALVAGVLVEYAPGPTHLIYALILVGIAAGAYAALRMPETALRKSGALASLVPRVGVPEHLRTPAFALVPILIATWALGGLYMSLGPSVAAEVFDMPNHVIGGLVVTLLCGTGALTIYALRNSTPARALTLATSWLVVGMVITLVGLAVEVAAITALGTMIAGVGFGASGRGTFGTIAALAGPEERGEVFAAFYVVSYLAFSLPALAAGIASTSAGLQSTALVYGAVVLALTFAAIWAQRRLHLAFG